LVRESGRKSVLLAVVVAAAAAVILLFGLLRDEPASRESPARPRSLVPVATPSTVLEAAPVVTLAPPPAATAGSSRAEEGRALGRVLADASAPAPANESREKRKTPGSGTAKSEKDVKTKRVAVHVHDQLSRRPVNGATVRGSVGDIEVEALTEVDGTASLVVPLEQGSVQGEVRHAHYERPGTFRFDPNRSKEVDVYIAVGALVRLEGTIHDTRGGSPSRATLRIRDKDDMLTLVSSADFDYWDETGRFRYSVVPAAYSFQANAPGFCDSDWTQRIYVSGSSPIALVVERPGTIAGFVSLPADLAPRESQVKIALDLECTRASGEVLLTKRPLQVATDTSFHVGDLKPGSYRLRAHDETHDGSWIQVLVDEGAHVEGVSLIVDNPLR
jgi:hypothetical protein